MYPLRVRMQPLIWLLVASFCTVPALAQEALLLEQYALASDREAWLTKLIPGTEEYYFFHTLQAQNVGRYEESRKLIEQWQATHGRTPLANKMLYRQVVLDYDKRPDESRDFLVRELGIPLYHELPATVRQKQIPNQLNPELLDPNKLVRDSIAQHGNLAEVHPLGLLQLDGMSLPIDQLRELLNRYPTIHDERLVKYILRELEDKESKGFGSLAVHQQLTLAQLDQLQQKRPGLLGNERFVFAKVARMRPGSDTDLVTDIPAWTTYLQELEAFTRTLPPAFRAFRASVLYRRLAALQAQGKYDLDLFIKYLELPRAAHYIQPAIVEASGRSGQPIAQLNEDFQAQALIPPIVHDELLVRDYLEHFLKDAPNPDNFAAYFKDEYLKRVFVETKILFGIGDAKTWFNQLSADEQRRLRERVEVTWAPTNPRFFDVEGPARIDVDVKNVPRLSVRVFRINLPAYYRQSQQPVNTDVDLDGLVAATQIDLKFDQQSWLRHRETLELKGVEGRGVWVVDIVGGDRRSRCLIARGDLRVVEEATADGHRFLVLDEQQRPVSEAKMIVNGQEYLANERGQIDVPYLEQAKEQQAVLVANNFAKIVPFTQQVENYSLHGSFYVHREGLQAGQKTTVVLRARLLTGTRPVSIKMLRNPVVTVTATDLDGSKSTQRFEDVQLFEDRETEVVIRTPPRLNSLRFELNAKAMLVSQDREVELSMDDEYAFETIRTSATIHQAQLSKINDGYRLEVVGHTGEPALAQPVEIELIHQLVKDPIHVVLAPDEQGHISLGALPGIRRLSVTGSQLQSHDWDLPQDYASWPSVLHLAAEEELQLPIPPIDTLWEKVPGLSKQRFQLIELRGGAASRDLTDELRLREGRIQVESLQPGTYRLHDLATNETVTIEVGKGFDLATQIVNDVRALETTERPTTWIKGIVRDEKQIVIELADVSKFTRVHLMPSRYVAPISPRKMELLEMPLRQSHYRRPHSGYVSDLKLDDEYRYILERALAKKYSGNMLPQPSLQLFPWDLGESQAKDVVMNAGAAMPPAPATAAMTDPIEMAKRKTQQEAVQVPGDPLTVEYLRDTGEFLVNLVPDAQGKVTIKHSLLGDAQQITLWVIDPLCVQTRQLGLPATQLDADDLRLAASLPPDKPFAQTRAVLTLKADEPFVIGDVQSARAHVYASLADLYQYYAAHIDDERFAKFSFLPKWNRLSDDEKRSKYNEFASHELHLFLYFKDRAFFDKIVKPLLEQKKDPKFIDRWLLGADLKADRELWRYADLNAAERALLAIRVAEMKSVVQRDMHDWLAMHPESPEVMQRRLLDALFDSGLTDGPLELELQQAEYDLAAGLGGFGGGMGGAMPKSEVAAEKMEQKQRLRESDKALLDMRFGRKMADRHVSGDVNFFGLHDARKLSRAFRQLESTKRWADTDYYRITVAQADRDLIPTRAFWNDVAGSPQGAAILSTDLLAPVGNFTEALLALAVSDLPLERPEVESKADAGRLVIKAAKSAIVVTEQIRPAKVGDGEAATVLIGQRFTADSAPSSPNGAPSAVKEYVIGEVYRTQVVVSNPTPEVINSNVLIQIPSGSLPLEGKRATDSFAVRLEPFSTQQLQVAFYFPHAGDFNVYGAVASKQDELLVAAPSTKITVLAQPSEPDANSWPYLVQHGDAQQIADYLRKKANLYQISLEDLAPRMADQVIFQKVIDVLDELRHYNPTLWGYAFKHHDIKRMREFVEHRDEIIALLGPSFIASWVEVHPIERQLYEHIEFRPLEVARKHPASGRWQIPNEELQQHWTEYMRVLAYQSKSSSRDQLSLVYFLVLQHRIEEAMGAFKQIDRKSLGMPYAYDYLAAYLNLFNGRYREAAEIAKSHQDAPLTFWSDRFKSVTQQVAEHLAMFEGESVKLPEQGASDETLSATSEMRRQRDQELAAALQPTIDLKIEGNQAFLKWQNLNEVQINYYLLDVELLFTRNPFVQQGSNRASLVEPNDSSRMKLPSKSGETKFTIPERLAKQNVLVEVVAGNMRQSQVASGGEVAVQFATGYGQLQASIAGSTKPLVGAYVKVYVRDDQGTVKFWKDGYTDLRGRFDYASVSGNDISSVSRFSVLVLEPEHGALIREVESPR